MTQEQPLSWKKVLLCAGLAGPVGLGLSVGLFLLIGTVVPKWTGLDDALGDGFTFVVTMVVMLLAYLPLTALLAFAASLYLVPYRRLAHASLAVALSVPATLLFLGLVYLFLSLIWG